MEWIAPLILAIKKAGPAIYAAVLIACSLLLFLPDPLLARFGLAEFFSPIAHMLELDLLGESVYLQ